MRRIALLATLAASGCGTLGSTPNVPRVATRVDGAAHGSAGPAVADGDAPTEARYGREAVPDSVMLQSQLGSGFRDSVVP